MLQQGDFLMQPWVIDANDMDAEDILNFRSNLLHPNQAISQFLDEKNKSISIVIAPKGYGKTLLLKAKRLSLDPHFARTIPQNNLVDKPSGSPSSIPTTEYGDLRKSEKYWRTVWLLSFAIAVLKASHSKIAPKTQMGKRLCENDKMISPCDIFDNILACSVGNYHDLVRDYNEEILPIFRQLHDPIAVFVDNIDEYYEGTLRDMEVQSPNTKSGIDSDFWDLAQTGIAAAARELSHINNHIKIYVSIRKEVLQRIIGEAYFGQQLIGKSIILKYTVDDLVDIICKNINASPNSDLVDKKAENPLARFLGTLDRVTHPATGDEERIEDFWIRHSLGRPRDIVAIGKAINSVNPKHRDERNVRKAVREAAKRIAKTYLGEMRPHFDGFDPDILLALIPKSVLSVQRLEDIRKKYADQYFEKHGIHLDYTTHPFCALYKIGLLGYVGRDPETGEDVQIFCEPGDAPIGKPGDLPKAAVYLIHPALDDAIAEKQPKYFQHLHSRNIIGPNRVWNRERTVKYVLKGDVVGYSEIMKDQAKNRAFNTIVSELISELSSQITVCQWQEGDSFLFLDSDPIKLLRYTMRFQRDLERSEIASRMRFGGDSGFIDIESDADQSSVKLLGQAVQRAARLEPHVEKGTIFVTGEFVRRFRDQMGKRSRSEFNFREVGPSECEHLPFENGKFDIRKNTNEAENPIAIYHVSTD